jgi:hypothetical protein
MLERCINRIKSVNDKAKTETECFCYYEIPPWTYGVPLYDLPGCIEYIIAELHKKGCKTQYIYPNNIYIDWRETPSSNTSTNYNNSASSYSGNNNISRDRDDIYDANNYKIITTNRSNSTYHSQDLRNMANRTKDFFN